MHVRGAQGTVPVFWRHHDFQAADEFHEFYRSVSESKGAGCLTDSSKSLDIFRRYHLDRKEHFYVVFLRKDLVSYYRSAKKRGSREKTELARIIKHNPARIVLRWLYHNSRMHAFLNNNQVAHLSTTYEEVCNHTAAVMDQVAQLAGLQYEDNPHFKNVHALRGNRARFQFLRDAVVAPCDTRLRIPARQRWLTHVDDFFNRRLAR